MTPPDMKALLRRMADELEAEEKGAESSQLLQRVEALEARKIGADELREALAGLSDDEVAELVRLPGRVGAAARVEEERRDDEEEAVEERAVEEEPPARRTRPGRKNGRAYLWTVDDRGELVESKIAHVYSGADEPDEVEIPAGDAA